MCTPPHRPKRHSGIEDVPGVEALRRACARSGAVVRAVTEGEGARGAARRGGAEESGAPMICWWNGFRHDDVS